VVAEEVVTVIPVDPVVAALLTRSRWDIRPSSFDPQPITSNRPQGDGSFEKRLLVQISRIFPKHKGI